MGRGGAVLGEPVVAEVAAAHGISPGQAVFAWHRARGVVPIPNAVSARNQVDNLGALGVRLSARDTASITALARDDGQLAGQDPVTHEEL